ncbi:hypothetical protein HJG60_008407 [Phyllostomus discolor]|uniref:Uncharacterized protein n=1 Tax=Phyllostomus discolor TaxID=89673 RepID=A0A833Z4W6_9CHIR|nr:hypothetical protein HJG60_008407 [Phyllostomus discolor]
MHPAVFSEPVLLGQALAAPLAGKWPLSFAQTPMFLSSGFAPKGLGTFRALEGPPPCGSSLVGDEAALPVVAPLALAALEVLLLTWAPPGPREAGVPSGLALVLRGLTGLAPGVAPSVLYQVSLDGEDLPADEAGMGSWPWGDFQVPPGTPCLMPWVHLFPGRCCDIRVCTWSLHVSATLQGGSLTR